ncbi:MAG: hypothetical protein IKR30_04605 [Bacteroidales bacterium]|nr:hypothetical protein [Bacteroidales bacterium]
MNKHYYHLCSNGTETKYFIICTADYFAAFNLIGVCAANTGVNVVSFSVEDSHPHILLYGTLENCSRLKQMYETLYRHYVAATRKDRERFVFHCELYLVDDPSYLRNVAAYTIIQATKDGKPVMPYDYKWGTGSLYFRNSFFTPPWYFDDQGNICKPIPFSSLNTRARRRILHTRLYSIPETWMVCNDVILPSNYIDISLFESIYRTHNIYRVFLASTKKKEEEMLSKMAEFRGVAFEDSEARRICGDISKIMFGTRDPRRLDGKQRIALAQRLRRDYHITFRQLATIVRLPETEVRAYVR